MKALHMRTCGEFGACGCGRMCKQSREICHGEGAVRGRFWRSVAVAFDAWFPRQGSGSVTTAHSRLRSWRSRSTTSARGVSSASRTS